MKLGQKLYNLRKSRNYTMEELSNIMNSTDEELKTGKSMISRWESCASEPTLSYLRAYAKVFNVTLDYLLDLEYAPKNNLSKDLDDFLKLNSVMGFNGIDLNRMTDEEKEEYKNALLDQIELLSYKYKK